MIQRTVVTSAIVCLVGVGCAGGFGPTGTGGIGGAACPQLRGGAIGADFGLEAKANATVGAFVQASGDLATVAAKIEDEVTAACTRMGADLGLTAADMQPRVGRGGSVQGACSALLARIDAIMREGASAKVRVAFTPPECKVSGEAYARCAGACNVSVDPGYVVAHCEPAKLSGQCVGTCQGQCDGACNGDCQGECTAKNASGQCTGQCRGTCSGRCDATCHARCQGEWRAPKCEADVKMPQADARCDASCKAHADITATCTEPRVNAEAIVNTGDIPKLVATLRTNLPVLIRAQLAYGARLADDVKVLVETGGELPRILGDASARALACTAASANAVANAEASLRVSVEVSASVTGRVGVSGG